MQLESNRELNLLCMHRMLMYKKEDYSHNNCQYEEIEIIMSASKYHSLFCCSGF